MESLSRTIWERATSEKGSFIAFHLLAKNIVNPPPYQNNMERQTPDMFCLTEAEYYEFFLRQYDHQIRNITAGIAKITQTYHTCIHATALSELAPIRNQLETACHIFRLEENQALIDNRYGSGTTQQLLTATKELEQSISHACITPPMPASDSGQLELDF